jgi:glycosyltransferase involved in cell wall biosynthesis
MEKYVCAFRGRRDSYQLPLALAEAGLLDQLFTDLYAVGALRGRIGGLPLSWREKILSRFESGLPEHRIKCLWGTTLLEHTRRRLGHRASITYAELDRRYSEAAARQAAKNRSHLFLYTPYAWEAFRTVYRHTPKKVLFQYHPHPQLERQILENDRAKYPFVENSFAEQTGDRLSPEMRRRNEECWKHADLILCASGFTKRSIVDAGAKESLVQVIPYGVELDRIQARTEASESFHALFVGNGVQRKGLHHLLYAWGRAKLPAGSRLSLICRTIDPGIEELVQQTPGVELVRGASKERLNRYFAECSVMVMPSLVEGFGQVYLEALAHGCPVLGTSNTCLPDLGSEADGVILVSPGDLEELTAKLETLSGLLPGDSRIRRRARACAEQFQWQRFRSSIRNSLV